MRDTNLQSVQALERAGNYFTKKQACATFDNHISAEQTFAPGANVQNSKVEPVYKTDKSLSVDDLITDIKEQCENAAPAFGLTTNSDVQITESGMASDADTKTSGIESTSDALVSASGATPDSVICTSELIAKHKAGATFSHCSSMSAAQSSYDLFVNTTKTIEIKPKVLTCF